MSKWEPIDPAEIQDGDYIRARNEMEKWDIRAKVRATEPDGCAPLINFSRTSIWGDADDVSWSRRKPKKPKRPTEPPVGHAVIKGDEIGVAASFGHWCVHSRTDGSYVDGFLWDDWIKPGDKIETWPAKDGE